MSKTYLVISDWSQDRNNKSYKKHFVHRYKHSHHNRRTMFKRYLKPGKVELLKTQSF